MADVTLRKVIKRYDDVEAVRGIDLDIADKEFVVLVGPSGCGKSTTLRMIAGLEDVSEGDVLIAGEDVVDVPPKDRDIAMVFQNYALYPHMTVHENMSFGLRLKRFARDEIERRVQNAARILDITELLERKPRQLSGGLRARLSDTIAFALPAERDPRYRPHAGKPGLILGLRPEHITDPRPPLRPAQRSFEVAVDVCEPLGMETLLHFTLQGIDVC